MDPAHHQPRWQCHPASDPGCNVPCSSSPVSPAMPGSLGAHPCPGELEPEFGQQQPPSLAPLARARAGPVRCSWRTARIVLSAEAPGKPANTHANKQNPKEAIRQEKPQSSSKRAAFTASLLLLLLPPHPGVEVHPGSPSEQGCCVRAPVAPGCSRSAVPGSEVAGRGIQVAAGRRMLLRGHWQRVPGQVTLCCAQRGSWGGGTGGCTLSSLIPPSWMESRCSGCGLLSTAAPLIPPSLQPIRGRPHRRRSRAQGGLFAFPVSPLSSPFPFPPRESLVSHQLQHFAFPFLLTS